MYLLVLDCKMKNIKKDNWQVDARIPLKDKLKYDVIWVIWDSILEEIKSRKQNNVKDILCIEKQVDALFHLFLLNYSNGKRTARLPYVFLAIGYLTLKTNFEIPIRNNIQAFIQSQANVNKMFEAKKIKSHTANLSKKSKKLIQCHKPK